MEGLEMEGLANVGKTRKLWRTRNVGRTRMFSLKMPMWFSALRAHHYWIVHYADAAPMFFLRIPVLNGFLKAQATMNMNKQVNASIF